MNTLLEEFDKGMDKLEEKAREISNSLDEQGKRSKRILNELDKSIRLMEANKNS
jgi:hypothetical protein